MNKTLAVGIVTALVACSSPKQQPGGPIIDAKMTPVPDMGGGDLCSVLTQAGCMTGQKCAWVLSTDPTDSAPGLGAIACAPDGTVAVGAACTIQPAAMGGNDNCKGGGACVSGVCKSICDNNGGSPACATGQACVTYDGLFANEGATTTPAGVCDPSCNPLADNDFDGSGTLHTKSGSGCGSSPTVGCYGQPSSTSTTYFTCSPPAGSTGNLSHRNVIPGTQFFVNDCMSGYSLAFAQDSQGTMNTDCYAFCAPGDAYMGNPGTQMPNGSTTVTPTHRCNQQDAIGNFGTPATATVNGEHCMYSWFFEQDTSTGVVHHSPTSDTVGWCWDHSKYQWDSNGDMMITAADAVLPPCGTVPLTSTTTIDAVNMGCVSTTLAGLFTSSKEELKAMAAKRLRLGMQVPEFFSAPQLKKSMR